MAVDKNKIIAEATKLVQKGAYDKAIKQYERILEADPKDVRVLLKVGELHQKKGDDRQAADAFKKVAETYADQGFFLKAVAVYKQIVKLDPDDVRVNERLAALYQQLGLMSDAMGQYQVMAAGYEKAGDGARLLDVLKRMVELDPDNIASSIKLGELHQRANQGAQALEHYRRAAGYLKKHNRADEYLKVAERIAGLAPDDHPLTRELANIYLAKGDTKRALSKLQLCFKADPKDVETLNLLAQAFRELGQAQKTVSVYKELARVHEERGRAADARSTWRKVLELAPDDPDALASAGASPAAAPTPPPRPAVAPPAPVQAAPRAPPPGPPPGAAARKAPPPAVVVAPPPPAAPAAAGPDAVAKLLTETDVYLKYGLHDKALDHLRKVLALDPEAPEAHERAREIHEAAGRRAEAVAAGEAAVRACLAKGLPDRARDALSRLRQLGPDHPGLADLAGEVGGTEEIRLDGGDVEEISDEPEPIDGAELSLDEEGGLPTLPPLEAPAGGDDDLALAMAGDEGDAVVDDEPAAGPAAELEVELDAEPLADDDDLAAAAAQAGGDDETIVDEDGDEPALAPAPAPPPRPAARAPVIAPAVPDLPEEASRADDDEEVDLGDELEEADFFVQQGLLDEAREALQNLLAFYPGHRQVQARLAEVERRAAPAAPAPARAARPAAGDLGAVRPSPSLVAPSAAQGESFDIAAELAGELDAAGPAAAADDEFQYSVEDVFNQFKRGVAETVNAEDSDTHYDLGIAYKEMGLLDDAVHEFETALKGTNRKKEVDALSMVGLCRMAQGRPAEAVEAFRRALRSDYLGKDSARALHFELGGAYEAMGQPQVALWFFQKVAKVDPAYRQASWMVAALGGGPGAPPADEARPAARPAPAAAPAARPAASGAPAAKKNIGYL